MKKLFYHGSYDQLYPASVLSGRGAAYEKDWSNTSFYHALEQHRPSGCLSHRDAVFLVASPDDIDAAGGATDWCSEVAVSSAISRHDVNWSTEISSLIEDGHEISSGEIRAAAFAYWNGHPHYINEPVWEYLTAQAIVLRCEPFDSFEIGSESQPSIDIQCSRLAADPSWW